MPLQAVTFEESKLKSLIKDIDTAANVININSQHILSSHLVLAGSGHVEKSVIQILSNYGSTHGNSAIQKYIQKNVSMKNSLNCEKIEKILNEFDKSWWDSVEKLTTESQRSSVDSLKTLRDQVAHGKANGTGLVVIKKYVQDAKIFVQKLSISVIGH